MAKRSFASLKKKGGGAGLEGVLPLVFQARESLIVALALLTRPLLKVFRGGHARTLLKVGPYLCEFGLPVLLDALFVPILKVQILQRVWNVQQDVEVSKTGTQVQVRGLKK